VKKQLTGWQKIFANHISDKGLILKLKKPSYNSIAEGLNRLFPKKTCRWPIDS